MSEFIRIRKGLDIRLLGEPDQVITEVKKSETYALSPGDFVGITPGIVVKEQQYVKAGEVLFVDKNHPEVKFVSPISGTVTAINRGERRKVLNIVVQADSVVKRVEFGVKSVQSMTGDQVRSAILESGLFGFFRQRPYDVVANPSDTPRDIFISSFDSKPLAPEFEFVLKSNELDFQTGLSAIAKIAPITLGINRKQSTKSLKEAKNVDLYEFSGPHPAGNVGVHINKIKPINKGEIVWTIDAEAVIFIGRLFNKGYVDFTRLIAVAGSKVLKPSYSRVLIGAKISDIIENRLVDNQGIRIINGNVLTGSKVNKDGYLGSFANMITVIPEGDSINEFMGWIMPRFNSYSVNRTFFSWIINLLCSNKKYDIDARIKGGERHMIMSGEYDKVFPMDIYPEFLIKAIIAGNIDKMEAYGIYEVAPEDFALCEFVDSSKLELQRIVRQGLDNLRKEMA
ncbi:MAG TPA: Na(+)-translocating NADH-quinone reductase subunit A [Bacteroidaceae bacterium]|nr:Na(+)-translocating NADH-quinone reductase subunit A [Bacteroidaceae bacterium]